mgnify:CR=1 FL=1
MTSQIIDPINYDIRSGTALLAHLISWTASAPNCGDIIFEIIDTSTNNETDGSFITMTNGNLGGSIKVETTDISKVGTYNLKLVGTIPAYSGTATTEENFVLNIVD